MLRAVTRVFDFEYNVINPFVLILQVLFIVSGTEAEREDDDRCMDCIMLDSALCVSRRGLCG